MRIKFKLLIVCLFASICLSAQTQEDNLAKLLKKNPEADTNKDGVLSEAEAKAFRLNTLSADEINWKWPTPPTFQNEAFGPRIKVNPALIGDNHLFDVWVPEGDGPFPVMIYAHGGGFESGSKVKALGSMPKIAEDKVVFISLNYTLKQGGEIAIKDIIEAINYIKDNHAKYKVNPEQIFLSGYSAGGIAMNYIIYNLKMPGILGAWHGAYYKSQFADLSIDNLREVGIPIAISMSKLYPEDPGHSPLAAVTLLEKNVAAGNPGLWIGKTGNSVGQVWLNGKWIKNVSEGIDTGEPYPGMAEWVYSIISKQTQTPSPTASDQRVYELWEREPVTNSLVATEPTLNGNRLIYFPYDEGWEHWSYPIGNGYMGANVFGRTDVERIQLTEKTLFNTGLYGLGGLTSFAEIDIHFKHMDVQDYKRSLNLNDAIAHVSYLSDGARHTREMFVSYPDQVMVINLKTDKPGALSFKLAPLIPYLKSLREEDKKTGTVVAAGNEIILSGTLPNEGNNFEAQFKVLNDGGTLRAEGGAITVEEANSVSILVAAGTNYELSQEVFLNSNRNKLDPSKSPHKHLSKIMDDAVTKGPERLKERHLADYRNLFNRVEVNLNSRVSQLPTHELLEAYQGDAKDTYLEELMFQYGRYLLIASSREKTLPSGLQGTWSQYEITPWTGGYWHNINVQMNYWGAFSANLAETFEAYINYYKAYQPKAQENARDFLNEHHPERVSDNPDQNGWAIGTGATPYKINKPGGHSGPGTGGFTTKMLMDYYEYTQDRDYLEEVAYHALLGMSRLFSKTLVPQDGLLLVSPSASPENPITKEQLKGMPGHLAENGRHYVTRGCTFDQGFVWENHTDVLKLAKILDKKDPFLETIREELPKLDPILIGKSGQLKEWREETTYSSIGQENHRHISHLCPLYPGTLINSSTPEWKAAAIKTLNFRGDVTTGWAMAHRMNCWARLGDGERAHKIYQLFIEEKTVPNLWTLHPPFQIDGNFGVMAGTAEMLLQSHEGVISVLPALPKAWNTGSFDGLVARGNFVLSARWKEMNLTNLSVTARSGGTCRLNTKGLENAQVVDANGKKVSFSVSQEGVLTFETQPGQTLQIVLNSNEKTSSADKKPNVVFILADDLGIAGLQCYGTEWLETPNLDRLCSEGMRFDKGYASHPTCQPSRIAILSGQYAPRTGGYRVMDHHRGKEHLIKYEVPELTGLSLEKTTFAEHFKANGYTTAMYGKWHAGNYRADLHPRYHGFDEAHVCRGHYDDSRSDPPLKLPEGMDSNEYFTYEAIKFMKGAVKKEQPFFLYMPYYLIHAPFEAPQPLIDHFEEKLHGMEFNGNKAELMPTIAAMTKHLDNCVGYLLDSLKEMGIEENTIVIFTSDNGAYTSDLIGAYRGQKGDVYEGGLRVPYFFKWPGKIEEGSRSDEHVTHIDLYPTFSDLAGLSRPEDYILDGQSLAGLLTGKTASLPERDIICYYPKYGQYNEKSQIWKFPWRNVIFSDEWKLREVVEYGNFELYNLKDDPNEENDLSESHPEKLQELIKKLRQWEKKVGAPELTFNPDYTLD